MNRFWDGIIKPIIKEIKPQAIVEVGAADGLNSIKALEYCSIENEQCHLHVIDPIMPVKLAENEELLKKFGTFHQGLSLDVLPNVKGDVYLVDGDHNWYTVYHELKLIFKDNTTMPTVFFHDIGWPYSRRDMYYDPSNIPPEHVLEYDQTMGIDINTNKLQSKSAFNRGLANAVTWGGARNGVLTAIEDFIAEADLRKNYLFLQLPILNGLGLLVAKEKVNGALGAIVSGVFNLSPNLLDVLKIAERERLKHMINYLDCLEKNK